MTLLRIACKSLARADAQSIGRIQVCLPAADQPGDIDRVHHLAEALAGEYGLQARSFADDHCVTVIFEGKGNE